ncbi:unnamed protein product [Paramecium octaurelia]|uniref:Uncharacterized protein n=1 Tax=Paramecium octaurelia TaxID=43137 RepID=A0A8S1Y3Z7_PAROT|nr:unnamed protein product [Paramecium octaurelia]
MLKIILLFGLVKNLAAETCPVKAITCESIRNRQLCLQSKDYNQNSICEWDQYKCTKSILNRLPCSGYTNEFTCHYKSYGCRWDGSSTNNYDVNSMKSNVNGQCVDRQCEDVSEYFCQSFGQLSCEWQDGRCAQITKCEDFQSIKGCRNSRFKKKCVTIVDGEVLPNEQISASNFDCVVQECKHKKYQFQCTFVNGVQFIWGTDGCSVCSSYTTYQSCVGNGGLCFWDLNQCQNTQCQQYKSPTLCNIKRQQCEWNIQKMRCQLNSTLENQHCYSEYLDQIEVSQTIQITFIVSLTLIG